MATSYDTLRASLLDTELELREGKKARLVRAAARKKQNFDPDFEAFDPDLYDVVDGDTLRHRRTGEKLRFQGSDGSSPDTFETSLDLYRSNPKRAGFHRRAYAKLFGRNIEDVSDQDLVNAGLSQKARFEERKESLRGQGFRRQGTDIYNRSLVQFDDPSVLAPITGQEGNAGYFAPSNWQQRLDDFNDNKSLNRPKRSIARAVTGDAVVNIGVGALRIVNDLTQAASVITGIGNFKPVQEFFKNNQGRLDTVKEALVSDAQLAREKFDEKEHALLQPLYGIRKAQYLEDNPGAPEWKASLSAGIDEAGDRIAYLIDNPGRILDATLESLPYMIGVGLVGRAATGAALRTLNGKALLQLQKAGLSDEAIGVGMAEFVASKATQKALRQVSARTGVATVGMTEGLSTSSDVYSAIVGMTEEEAKQSDKYNELRSKGLSHQEAVTKLAKGAFTETLITVTVLAAIASAVTGAGAFESQLFHRLGDIRRGIPGIANRSKQIAASIAGPGARELVEESIQSGGGEFLSQLASFDATGKPIGPGVGAATAEGAVIGLASGAGISAVSQAGKGAVAGAGVVARSFKKAGATRLGEAQGRNVIVTEDNTTDIGGNSGLARTQAVDPKVDVKTALMDLLDATDEAISKGEPTLHLIKFVNAFRSQWLIDKPNTSTEEIAQIDDRIDNFLNNFNAGLHLKASQIVEDNTAKEIKADKIKLAVLAEANRLTGFKYKGDDPELKNALSSAGAVQAAVDKANTSADANTTLSARYPVSGKTQAQVREEKLGSGLNKQNRLGLQGHVNTITEAIQAKDQKAYTKRERTLQKFVTSQTNKLAAYESLASRVATVGEDTETILEIEANIKKTTNFRIKWKPAQKKHPTTSGTVGFIKLLTDEVNTMTEVHEALKDQAAMWFGPVAVDEAAEAAEETPTEAARGGVTSRSSEPAKTVSEEKRVTSPPEAEPTSQKSIQKSKSVEEASASETPVEDDERVARTSELADDAVEQPQAVEKASADTTTTQKKEQDNESLSTKTEQANLQKWLENRFSEFTDNLIFSRDQSSDPESPFGTFDKVSGTVTIYLDATAQETKEFTSRFVASQLHNAGLQIDPKKLKDGIDQESAQVPLEDVSNFDIVDDVLELPDTPTEKTTAAEAVIVPEPEISITPDEVTQQAELLLTVEQIQGGIAQSSSTMEQLKLVVDFLSDSVAKYLGPLVGIFKTPNDTLVESAIEQLKAKFKELRLPTQITQAYKNRKEEVFNLLAIVPNTFSILSRLAARTAFFRMTSATAEEQQGFTDTISFVRTFTKLLDNMHQGLLDDLTNLNTPFKQQKRGKDNIAITNVLREYLLQFLLDAETGKVQENIASIMALEAANWLATSGSNTLNNTDDVINDLIGRPEGSYVEDGVRNAFANGTLESTVITQLGIAVLKQSNLGLRGMQGLDPHFQGRLIASIGAMTVAVMTQTGRIRRVPISGKYRKKLQLSDINTTTVSNERASVNLIYTRPLDDEFNSFIEHPANVFLRKSMLAANRLLKTYFEVDVRKLGPHLSIPATPTKVAGSNNLDIPAKQQSNIQKASKAEWVPIESLTTEREKLGRESFLDIMGLVSQEEIDGTIHGTQLKSVNSRNASIVRAFDYMVDWAEENGSKIFHFAYKMIGSGRILIDSNTINAQTNKAHRFMYGINTWKVTMSTSLNPRGDNIKKLKAFKIAVAMALDIKVDSLSAAEIIKQLNQLLSSDEIQNVITIMQKDTYDDADKVAIFNVINGIKKVTAGDGVHTLAGLRAWSDLIASKGKRKVTLMLPMEIDGKTNGYISSLLQMPPLLSATQELTKDMLRAGAIYFNEDQLQNYAEFAGNSLSRDNYEQVQELTDEFANQMLSQAAPDLSKPAMLKEDAEYITDIQSNKRNVSNVLHSGFLKLTRDFAKTPLMIIAYGAGITSIRTMLKGLAVKEFYEQLAKAGSELDTREEVAESIADILARLQLVVDAGKLRDTRSFTKLRRKITTQLLSQYQTIEDLAKYRREYNPFEDKLIQNSFEAGMDAVFGHALHKALEIKLAPMIDIRQKINEANYFMNLVFTTDFRRRISQEQNRRNEILSDKDRKKILNGMIQEGLVPLVKSPMSQSQLDSIETTSYGTVILEGDEKGRAYFKADKTHSDGKYQLSIKGYDENGNPTKPNSQASIVSGLTGIDPNMAVGVSAIVNLIHSSDGAVNGDVMGKFDILNVHDASVGNFLDIDEIGQYANQRFYEVHRDWNMANEILDAYSRLLPLVEIGDPRLSKADKLRIQSNFHTYLIKFSGANKSENSQVLFNTWQESLRNKVNENNQAREKLFSQIAWVNQFAKEGTEYPVPSSDSGAINLKKSSLVQKAKTVEEVLSLIRTEQGDVWAQKRRQVIADLHANLDNLGNTQSILNKWIRSTNVGHSPSAEDMLDVLFVAFSQRFKGNTDSVKALRELVSIIRPHLRNSDREITVRIGDKEQMGLDEGQYDPVTDTIHLREDASDPVAALLHELIHAANVKALEKLESAADNSEFKALVKEANEWQKANLKADDTSVEYSIAVAIQYASTDVKAVSEWVAYLNATLTKVQEGRQNFFFAPEMREHLNNLARTLQTPNGTQTFYSSGEELNNALFENQAGETLTRTNLQEVFARLRALERTPIDPSMQALWDRLLDDYIMEGLTSIDGLIFKMATDSKGKRNIGKLLTDGEIPLALFQATAENKYSSNVDMSLQEVAIHEILHAMFGTAITGQNSQEIRKKVETLFKRVQSEIGGLDGWKMFMPQVSMNIELDEKLARARWDHIFSNGSRGYHEFMALGLSNPQFIAILKNISAVQDGPIFGDGLIPSFFNILAAVINWIKGELFRSTPDTVHTEVSKLMEKIIGINFKQQRIAKNGWDAGIISGRINSLNDFAVRKLAALYSDKLGKWADNNTLTGEDLNDQLRDKNTAAKVLLASKTALASLKVADFKAFRKTFESALWGIKKDSPLYQMLTEIMPRAERNRSWLDVHRKSEVVVDMKRQATTEHTRKALHEFFDKTVHLTKSVREAISHVVLDTDLSSLLGGELQLDEHLILDLLNDPSQITQYEKGLEQQLSTLISPAFLNMFNKQSEGLATLMMQGEVVENHQMYNIVNIVKQRNLHVSHQQDLQNPERITVILDQLTTLRALKQVEPGTMDAVLAVMNREMKRSVRINGFNGLIGMAESFKAIALKKLFKGNPIFMWKGYVAEILDEDIQIRLVPATDENHKEMLKGRWKQIGTVPLARDPMDRNPQVMNLYKISRGVGNFSSSTISLTGEQKRGMGYFEGMFSASPDGSVRVTAANTHAMITRTREDGYRAAREQLTTKPVTVGPKMLPNFNEKGEIVDYRYIMTKANKREHLKKRTLFDEVLPAMFASIEDRVNTKTINREAVDLLHDEYLANVNNKDIRFVEISATAKTEEGKVMWNLLPKDTRIAAEEAFGADVLYVRDDVANIVFGFRKMTVANSKVLGPLTPAARIAEKIWMEIIQWERFRIAVLNPVVVFGNMISNIAMLLSQGIPPQYILKMASQGIIGMRRYQKQIRERNQLRVSIGAKQALNQSTKADQAEYARLLNNVDENPVHKLVEEGLFTSIVEEFGLDEQSTRRKLTTMLLDKFGNATGSKLAVRVTQEAWMVPGSETAQLALMATQYGDFVGRFIQYNWNMRGVDIKTAEGKARETVVIHEALDAFIYYNTPHHRILQFLNDYGFMMFTKFFFRIQRIVIRQFKRNPIQSLLVLGVQEMTTSRVLGENITNYGLLRNVTGKFDITPYDDITSGEIFRPTFMKWVDMFWPFGDD